MQKKDHANPYRNTTYIVDSENKKKKKAFSLARL